MAARRQRTASCSLIEKLIQPLPENMAATKIMIVRHAEKPTDDGSISGVSQAGTQDPEELIVRGWQRAGALLRFFDPMNGQFVSSKLATPDIIFASSVTHHIKSLRPQHTVLALADLFQTFVAHLPERTVDRIALRIEDASFERNVNVGFHGNGNYTL